MNAGPAAVEAGAVLWLRVDQALASSARREATVLAEQVGLSGPRTYDLALAVTEAATNLQRHSVDGALALRVTRNRSDAGVEFLALDSGPGIPDLRIALTDGNSSAGTLGLGLGTINRLADYFGIHTLPGRGTALVARFFDPTAVDPGASADEVTVGGLTRPISGEEMCGDTWAARQVAGGPDLVVMMCDGLGHGPLAARAAEAARLAFRESSTDDPAGILTAVHTRLKGTRGAAVAVARLDTERRQVQLCGAGNITGFVLGTDVRHSLMSIPGIVGHSLPRLQAFRADLPAGWALVLHSDGIGHRWQPRDLPGLLGQDPDLIAGQILWQAGTRRDDAGIVVVKGLR